jgi:O-acetylserine/cysteine efflux transporter
MVWGGNFTAAKISTSVIPPLMTMALRMALVSVLLLPYYRRINISFKNLALLAFNNSVVHHGLLFCAVGSGLSVAATVLTMQLNVPLTSIFGYYLLDIKISLKQMIGMIIAFIGIGLLVGSPHILGNMKGFMMALIGAVFFAIYNIQIKKLGNYDIYAFLAWTSLIATVMLTALSLILEPVTLELFRQLNLKILLSIGYMAISSIIGFGLWCYLIQKYSISFIAPFSLLIPVFGILSARLIVSEELSAQMILGAIVTLTGIAIIILKLPKSNKI